ncbi:MAG: BrxA/BrxB family bacilliredoxin [Flavobacteriia bacterium]|jgi:putative YphP/YqiW family bacilliredoxin|nr:BrxA/BrxB family bacilliredoxin [Flavobacteriia bacterium]NBV67808.1 BrxA/BrxB family bacilliredoxin [Flavobacteriia bacterium]NBV91805.1 BrxA/BrxB family bacilliredoxin [Flavobacteriia bacterium]NBY41221.1 BrxA/BrxB family bacilliredoxin [Flavobacteriia bacterium]
MYPLELVQPMKNDLIQVGFKELLNGKEVVDAISSSKGTMILVVNSVCGCAAGNMRPGVKKSLTHTTIPNEMYTVFAGVDAEAVNQARQYFLPYPPSSPCIAIFHDGALVHFLERHHIEGATADMIADNLRAAYDEFCK